MPLFEDAFALKKITGIATNIKTNDKLVATHAELKGTSAHGAVATNTANQIVTRGAAGEFAAGNITAALMGAASLNALKSGDIMSGVLTQNGANLAGTAYQSQSFQNLLKNGDFESWSAGAAAAPDGWTLDIGAIARDGTNKIKGLYSAALTNTVDSSGALSQNNFDVYYRGKTISAGVWVKASVSNRVYFDIADGIKSSASANHSGDGTWQFLTATIDMDASATYTIIRLCISIGTSITANFDGAILVEGSVVPSFSPRPLYDDGKTLVIDSAANTVTSPKIITPSIAPAADLVITQNAVSAMTMVAAAAIVNTLYLKEGKVGIGTAPATKLDVAGAMQVSSASLGGYVRKFAEATGTPGVAALTFDIAVNVPAGAKLLGTQLRVDTALTAGEDWGAAYIGGSTTAIAAAGQVVTKNTKVNKMHVDEITTNTTNVRITSDSGNFTEGVGVIRAIVYYETFTAMGDAA